MDGRKKILGWLVNHFEVRRVMAADYVGDTYTDRNIIIQGRGMCWSLWAGEYFFVMCNNK